MENWTRFRYPHLFGLWQRWLGETQWHQLDRWLRRYFQGQRNFGKRDRLAYANAMFSAMRILQLIDVLERLYTEEPEADWGEWDKTWTPDNVRHIRVDRFWFWVALYFDTDAPAATELDDAEERRQWFLDTVSSEDKRLALGIADFWYGWRPMWNAALDLRVQTSGWSEIDRQAFIVGQNSLPPVWLRPQQGMDNQSLLERLDNEGVRITLQDGRLAAQGGTGLLETASYKSGLFEIQDYASQMIAESVGAEPGQKVWDACAGAGGKTLSLAEKMQSKGALIATDIREYKLEELKRRAKRAGYFNIRSFGWDAEAPLKLPREVRVHQGFDRVLIDAPCSSTGTWRRNPDARWRDAGMPEAPMLALQQHILSQASHSVRPGGRLVYATCSWFVEENEQQVAAFLAAHPQFALVQQTMLGFPNTNSDAMFSAVLERKV